MKLLKTLILRTVTTLMVQAITPLEIVQKSDNIRNPNDSFYQKGLITEFQNAQKVDSMLISIYSKKADDGQFKTLVKILKPKKDREKLILRNGNTMWMYDPNSKAIAQMSPQQRLMGQSSSADVMSANFALDYTLKLEGVESIKGGDKKMVECYKIAMTAIISEVSYPTVEYWVAKDTFYPIHAKFYSANGEVLKKSYYRKFQNILGAVRPTEVLIFDGVDTNKATKLSFSDFAEQEIPDFWFIKEYLSKFRGE